MTADTSIKTDGNSGSSIGSRAERTRVVGGDRSPVRAPVRWFRALILGTALVVLAGCHGSVRGQLTYDELMRGSSEFGGPLQNEVFLPSEDAGPAHHSFNGVLVLSPEEMNTSPAEFATRTVFDRDAKLFPGASLAFFSVNDHLVPVDRNLILVGSLAPGGTFWDILVYPGRIWSEPGDHGWSRASFGFALANALEGESHNGVATFLFNGSEVSDVRYQIVSQGTPYYVPDFFVAWGQLEADFDDTPVAGFETLVEAYTDEVNGRFPMAPLSDLEARFGAEVFEGFDGPINPKNIVVLGLVLDGTLYHSPCRTEYGDLPYCNVTRFGVWSTTKTAMGSMAMLRLAQIYGPEVFEERIIDYLDVEPPHDGWDNVTFGDALNMATGIGEGSEKTEPNNPSDGYKERYEEWYDVASLREKVTAILSGSVHSWGPGRVFRYRDQDLFLLGAAMDGFIKTKEGADASLWEFIKTEVFQPIGIRYAPANLTLETDGSAGVPQIAGGYYPTIEDLARIATLIQEGGAHQGRQILHPGKLAEMMYQTPVRGLQFGTPDAGGTYHMAVWHTGFETASGCRIELSYMSGWGGHKVLMLPNGLTAIRIAHADAGDAASGDPTGMARVADRIRPLCR
jgi:CubicO group peptidase (beta-lactamase class C family)